MGESAADRTEEARPRRIVVGRVVRPHGVKGALLVRSETDHPSELFVPGRALGVREPPPGAPSALTLREARPHGSGWLLETGELTDRTMAERYAGRYLTLPREELRELAEEEYFLHDLVGLTVVTTEGRALGEVGRVYETPAAPTLAVSFAGRERLIPFRREVVVAVDLAAGRLVVELPEGLLDI